MTAFPPPFPNRRDADADHLKLLSIFHFIGAGLALVGILFLFAHYAIFRAIIDNSPGWDNQKQAVSPAQAFEAFKWIYPVLGAFFLGCAVVNLLAGMFLRGRKHRLFCLFVAGINCLHMPLGTTLGVFTIIVLMRDSVRVMFEARSYQRT